MKSAEACDEDGIGFVGLGALQLALSKSAHGGGVDQRNSVPGVVERTGDGVTISASGF